MRISRPSSTGRRFLAIGAIGGALLLSACGSSKNPSGSSTGLPNAHTVTVHGMGIVKVTPDVLNIVFGAEHNAPTAKAAMDTVATASDAIVKLAKSNNVDKKDIQSSQIFLSPTYDYTDGISRLTGYTASITITVSLHDPSKASGLLDAATSAAGDALRLRGMSWSVDDPTKALEQARVAAMEDAKTRAGTLAKTGNVKLGKPLTINESSQSVTPPSFDESTGGKGDVPASPGVAIEAGTQNISVSVDVVFEIG